MIKNLSMILGAIILATGFMFLFFGGTWAGVRFGLQVLGGVWILQTAHQVLVENDNKKKKEKEIKETVDKYFGDINP